MKKEVKLTVLLFWLVFFLTGVGAVKADTGYDLWLRYNKVTDKKLLKEYRSTCRYLYSSSASPTVKVAETEFKIGIHGLLSLQIKPSGDSLKNGTVVVATVQELYRRFRYVVKRIRPVWETRVI